MTLVGTDRIAFLRLSLSRREYPVDEKGEGARKQTGCLSNVISCRNCIVLQFRPYALERSS